MTKVDLKKLEFDVKKVINEQFNTIKYIIKTFGRTYFDKEYYNEYTETKPSDIKNDDIIAFVMAAIIINNKSWQYYSENNEYMTQVYSDAYHMICRTIYSDNTLDKNDVMLFTRLID